MTEPNMMQIRADHGPNQTQWEDRRVRQVGDQYGTVSLRQGLRRGFWDGVRYVLSLQYQLDQLTTGELVAELRKREGSIYWPVKADDPAFWDICDRCGNRVLFDADGDCRHCGAVA